MILSRFDGHYGCFQFLVITSKVAMNIIMGVSLSNMSAFNLGKSSGVEILGHRVD